MENNEVSRQKVDLKDVPDLISPPILLGPLYRCAVSVTVIGFIPHAEIDVSVDGIPVATVTAGFPLPDGANIRLPNPLDTGQQVSARQRHNGRQSIWCDPVTVRNHLQDYPAGPPRPEINPAPVYKCGSRTGVSNLLQGGNVWITADGTEVGRINGCSQHQGVNITPDYGINQKVRAWFELCADPSPPSIEHITQIPPAPVPTPSIDPLYDGGEQLRVNNIANGARVTVYRNGVNQGTWRCWGYALLVGLNPTFRTGETLEASQTMCLGDPGSGKGSTIVSACANLPAPRANPVQVGDDRIVFSEFVPDAILKVYINFVKVGESGGPVVILSRRVAHGDIIHIEQVLGACRSQTIREVQPRCVAPPVTYDPSARNLFPVGFIEYSQGDVKGSIYYPANDEGKGKPLNTRLGILGRLPIVFIAHGNHGTYYNPANRLEEWGRPCGSNLNPPAGWLPIPNYQGYDYFQQDLAKMGFIAVSVDCNTTNCRGGGPSNIEERADLIVASIDYLRSLDANSASVLYQHIDFQSIGLMGHSRGGDAVVLVPEVINLPNTRIKAVISLAPTSFGPSSGQPKGYAFMTILPAGDGDVWSNDGAKFYDKAIPDPYKSQLYVFYANHNFFNRQWLYDDHHGPPVTSRYDHERILSTYGCAFYRAVLMGHGETIRFLAGHMIPAGVSAENVHLSFEIKGASTVDNHEDGNGIGLNSMGSPTAQSGGLVANEYPFNHSSAGSYNRSFFGNSMGMVASTGKVNGTFRSQLKARADLSKSEIWVRSAEVYSAPNVPSGATGFELGAQDANGVIVWLNSDGVGGLPRPYHRRDDDLATPWIAEDGTKTMLNTFRFPGSCFVSANSQFDLSAVDAIYLRLNRSDERSIAFDDLQIVSVVI